MPTYAHPVSWAYIHPSNQPRSMYILQAPCDNVHPTQYHMVIYTKPNFLKLDKPTLVKYSFPSIVLAHVMILVIHIDARSTKEDHLKIEKMKRRTLLWPRLAIVNFSCFLTWRKKKS